MYLPEEPRKQVIVPAILIIVQKLKTHTLVHSEVNVLVIPVLPCMQPSH